jgi:hypothetical protein
MTDICKAANNISTGIDALNDLQTKLKRLKALRRAVNYLDNTDGEKISDIEVSPDSKNEQKVDGYSGKSLAYGNKITIPGSVIEDHLRDALADLEQELDKAEISAEMVLKVLA